MPPSSSRPTIPDTSNEFERARERSKQIELELAQEAVSKKRGSEVSILAIGQRGTEKSKLLKQLRLLHDRESINNERHAWKYVIYVNILSSLGFILNLLDPSLNPAGATRPTTPSDEEDAPPSYTSSISSDFMNFRNHLSPLLEMETRIISLLGARYRGGQSGKTSRGIIVRSGWQRLCTGNDDTINQCFRLIEAYADDIRAFFRHPHIQETMWRRRVVMTESTFLLNQLDKVVSPSWVPTDQDILLARLETDGVSDYSFEFMRDRPVKWRLFDVEGGMGQLRSWIHFFEKTNVILFFVPLYAFDEYLDGHSYVNRIEDSLNLFTEICAYPLMRKTTIVLLFTGINAMKQKLRSGVQISKFILSYGDRPNDHENAIQYFKKHFQHTCKKYNTTEAQRTLFTHIINEVNENETEGMISTVLGALLHERLVAINEVLLEY